MSFLTYRHHGEIDSLVQTSEFVSPHNPLTSVRPDLDDMTNAQRAADYVRNIPRKYQSKSFSIATASVTQNETILSITGLKDMTLDEWQRAIPSRVLGGGYISFDRVCIHIPFQRQRRKRQYKTALWIVGICITLGLIALAIVLMLRR